MIWLVGAACLALGAAVGVIAGGRLGIGSSRVQELEAQVRRLKDDHRAYRNSVSDHFSQTAQLVQHMTDSYRDVYQHLAGGARELCSTEVASQLLPARGDAAFGAGEPDGPVPPRDYADRPGPTQKGALSEEFGIEKPRPDGDEPRPGQTAK